MRRAWWSGSIEEFLDAEPRTLIAGLAAESAQAGLAATPAQLAAWDRAVDILRVALDGLGGSIYLEFSIPRMGRRADAVLLVGPAVLVVEFKVGEASFTRAAEDQVWDYALDLKNFHETSHAEFVVPILVATEAPASPPAELVAREDRSFPPLRAAPADLRPLVDRILAYLGNGSIDRARWESGRYRPTPTIIEAATALYHRHSVEEISRNDAGAVNLAQTSRALADIIRSARERWAKAICFVTGVPGAGKTLVGLDTATRFMAKDEHRAVFLSGNGPLVRVLCEALARDEVRRAEEAGRKDRISDARRRARTFIQNVHHFRDECLKDLGPPVEHVAIFDEAQRAWDIKQTAEFMRRKKKRTGFPHSEPAYLISCLDRHPDWAVVICLVGGGQEINTGEAGIGEWIRALGESFPAWEAYISPRLTDSEYDAARSLEELRGVRHIDALHLATSMRSFRAESVSEMVKRLLDLDVEGAREALGKVLRGYPVVVTRKLEAAKRWLKERARGSERYGIIVSSQAERLRPHAIAVRSPVDPVHWFLDGKEDVRSSYYLEDVATEFHVQGLELDWACVAWDADLRHAGDQWQHWSFRGDRWNRIHKPARQRYLKNAYRVLLTRARQGMVLVVPEGDREDPTRDPAFYDPTYEYLRKVGVPEA